MKARSLIQTAALLFLALTAVAGAGPKLVDLQLAGATPGAALGTGGSSLPLTLPSRLMVTEGNRLLVEESFTAGAASLPGLAAVIYKTEPGGRSMMQFDFPPAVQPRDGVWRVNLRMLFASGEQKGNFNLTLRNSEKVAFYLQISAGGRVSMAQPGGETTLVATLPQLTRPLNLSVVLDFAKGEAALFEGGQPLGGPGGFDASMPMKTLYLGVTGENASRTLAIDELTFAQE